MPCGIAVSVSPRNSRDSNEVRHRPPGRRHPVLVKGHADLLALAPDDVAGNVRGVLLKDEVETLGDVVGVSDIDRRPRNGDIADQAVNGTASELNCRRHQYRIARIRASLHETMVR